MAPRKNTKTAQAPEPVVTPEPVVEVVLDSTPVAEVEEVASVPSDVVQQDKYVLVLERLNKMINDAKELITVVKVLQKEDKKASKKTEKKTKRSKAAPVEGGAPRPVSGFAKPSKLSDSLCTFLGVPAGTSMARTDVTRVLNEYIKTNNLQTPTDKRVIVPDEKLKSILSLQEGENLTYFNLQKHIKQHFSRD